MPPISEMINDVASWSELGEPLEKARDACTRLRFHEGLRRRIPEAAAESRVRGAHASAALDGARGDLDYFRNLARGAATWPATTDPAVHAMRGAVLATFEAEHAAKIAASAPMQALARLHVAAASPMLPPEQVGRPRMAGESCGELTDIGPAPEAALVPEAMRGIVGAMKIEHAPALVVAALVHGEILRVRPFVRGNSLVARALERALIISRGLDPTAVCVPEVGHHRAGATAYLGAATAYAQGSREGIAIWVEHCAGAVVAAAAEGEAIADAVRAGKLPDRER
ncbi:MAG: Fic family protein [Dermatophilus congolensis]|nr:Fic family protein [Dermatophilus congolensis]